MVGWDPIWSRNNDFISRRQVCRVSSSMAFIMVKGLTPGLMEGSMLGLTRKGLRHGQGKEMTSPPGDKDVGNWSG